jgi:hypothetical protein
MPSNQQKVRTASRGMKFEKRVKENISKRFETLPAEVLRLLAYFDSPELPLFAFKSP